MPVPHQSTSRFLKLRHIIGVLLAVLLLSGCSAVKLAYHNAPELSYWWLDSYLDFTPAQSSRVRSDLTALQSWHRQHELPLYAATLEKLQAMAGASVSAGQLCAVAEELRPRLQALLDSAEPMVLAISPTLTMAQMAHLTQQFDKRAEKWRQDWLAGTALERRERRLKQLLERAEPFYGRIDKAQRALLQNAVADSLFDADLNHREALRRQQDTLQTLRRVQGRKPDEPGVRVEMRGLIERAMSSPDTEYRNYASRMQLETCTTLAALHNSSTAEQRRHLMEALKDYESDARALMTNPR
ncbi:MAG: DUF6279 family lipoprotein [Comamonadaceae bacterium]